jgi:hypothetical protein
MDEVGGYVKVYSRKHIVGDVSCSDQLCLQEGENQIIMIQFFSGDCTFCEGQYNISKLDGNLLAMGNGGFGSTTKNRFSVLAASDYYYPFAYPKLGVCMFFFCLQRWPNTLKTEL